jgi:polar amino acid transport system substrate-binding protein
VCAAVLTGSAAGCGTQQDVPERASMAVAVDESIAAKVPEAIRTDGKLVVGIDPTYPPAEFLAEDGRTVVGFDVDLFDAVAAKLGLKTQYTVGRFDDIVFAVNDGTYEVGVSSFTVNQTRKLNALMVSYFQAGTQWATQQGNPQGVDPKSACGKKVAVQATTVQHNDLELRSAQCILEKKPEITIGVYREQDHATAALVAGKEDAMLVYSPVGAYAVAQSGGALQLLGDVYNASLFGYAVAKNQPAFAEALRDAVKALIADGTYATLLTRWGVSGGAITEPKINP